MCACDELSDEKFCQQLEFGVDSRAPGVVLTYIGDDILTAGIWCVSRQSFNPRSSASSCSQTYQLVAFREPGGSTYFDTPSARPDLLRC